MTAEIIAAIASGIVAILGAFYGFNKWMIKTFLHELRPNGGSSLKDQINRLEERVDDIYKILANGGKK
jgi:hypothetical protein